MASEAYVKINEVLKDAPALTSVANQFVVGGAIKADYGDFEVTMINSRKELLDKYVVNKELTGTCDISLINAYIILGSCPIVLCRASSQDYSGLEVSSDDKFKVVFKDFMSDGIHKVEYELSKSAEYPGANVLKVGYRNKQELSKYTYAGPSSIVSGGTGYQIGDLLKLTPSSGSDPKPELTAKVRSVDDGVITDIQLINSVGIQFGESPLNFSMELINTRLGVTNGEVSLTFVEDKNYVREYKVIFSLDESVTDDKGNSLYYKNVWQDDYPFEVVLGTVNPTQVTIPNPYKLIDPTQPDMLSYLDYGPTNTITSSVESTISGVSTVVNDQVNNPSGKHWNSWLNYEGSKISIFTDLGVSNIGTQLKELASEDHFFSMYALSLPRDKESVNGARQWDDIDLGNSRRYACTPFAISNNLGFLTLVAPSTQYILTVLNNAGSGREFEAVAGQNTGIASYSKLTKNFNKAEREALLDLKINTITYSDRLGYAFFNDDLTGLVQNNPFKEEFNRRLGIRIAHDIDELMQQFKFRLNTSALRGTVEVTLNTYFEASSFKDKISDFEIICNDSNNPPSLQAQNKLAVTVNVAFYYTAKYIEVVNNIYSVGQSFNK